MFDRRKDAAQNAQTDRPTPAPGRAGAPAGGLGASRPGAGVGANPGAVGAGPVGGAAGGPVGGAIGAKAAIGPTILVKGELSGDEDVVIAGQFEGEIDLPNHTLTIVEGGQVRANIQADNVVVQGEATGDVTGFARVVVVRTGHVRGNIKSRSVIIEDGAVFNGSIDMTGPEAEGAGAAQRASAPSRSRAAGSGDAGGSGRAAGDGAAGARGAPQPAQSKPSP